MQQVDPIWASKHALEDLLSDALTTAAQTASRQPLVGISL